jgi:hypothetical protein
MARACARVPAPHVHVIVGSRMLLVALLPGIRPKQAARARRDSASAGVHLPEPVETMKLSIGLATFE